MRPQRGFTLVEMIMVIVITGIVAGMVAVFIARPVQGYVDSVRRAGMTDVADLALKRMALDIRTAVPNSVRVDSTGRFLEFIPAKSGGRYCTDSNDCPTTLAGAKVGDLDFGSPDAGGNAFDLLGSTIDVASGESIIVYNTGQCIAATCSTTISLPCSGLNAYEGCNRRLVASTGTALTALSFTATDPPFSMASPSNRFQLVSASGPVTYACEAVGGSTTGTGTLRRYTGYSYFADQPTTGLGIGALLAENLSACTFVYGPASATNGLAGLSLTLTRDSESVTLYHQIHVDNMP